MREMQYHPPTYRLSVQERRYLVKNKEAFIGHHCYLFQLTRGPLVSLLLA